jgi:2-polyprenyl-3-methyl-5-hydroxy-6-metoxy-1,4-benzoquinol methylase
VYSFLDHRTALLRRTIARYCDRTGIQSDSVRILDIGCKTGEMVFYLLQHGYDAYGVDPVANHIRECAQKQAALEVRGDRFFKEECGRLTFSASSFDVVCAFMVLEHVGDLDTFLSDARRLLKPEGVLFCHVPNLWWPIEGHVCLPFAHWLPSRLLNGYLRLAGRNAAEWGPFIREINYHGAPRWRAILRGHFQRVDDLTAERLRDAARQNGHSGIRRMAYAAFSAQASSTFAVAVARRLAPLTFACYR